MALKHGVGSTYASHEGYERCAAMAGVGARWHYNWHFDPGSCPDVEAVPMIWGGPQVDTLNADSSRLKGNSIWVMGFNEPNISSQANLTPAAAAVKWHTVERLYPDRKLLSPAVSQDGIAWLRQFYGAYRDRYGYPPRMNNLAVHIYAGWTLAGAKDLFRRTLDEMWTLARSWGINGLQVTEWAYALREPGQAGIDETVAFIPWAIKEMEGRPYIYRHAYFQLSYAHDEPWAFGPDCWTSLVDYTTGDLTVFGEAYRDAAGVEPEPLPLLPTDVDRDGDVDIDDIRLVVDDFGR